MAAPLLNDLLIFQNTLDGDVGYKERFIREISENKLISFDSESKPITISLGSGVTIDGGELVVSVPEYNGAVTTILDDNLTINRALISNAQGKVAVSSITATELGYLSGVTSNIQTQINGKANTLHTHAASHITSGTLTTARGGTNRNTWTANRLVYTQSTTQLGFLNAITANRALISNSSGMPIASSVTSTELGYLTGVTSNIQTQIDSKINTTISNYNTLHPAIDLADVWFVLEHNNNLAKIKGSDIGGVPTLNSNETVITDNNGVLTTIPLRFNTGGFGSNQVNLLQIDLTTNPGVPTITLIPQLSTERAMVTDSTGMPTTSDVTATELGYLSGVTSNIQTQINNIPALPSGADSQTMRHDGAAWEATDYLRISSLGVITISDLSGEGLKYIGVDNNGVLQTMDDPGGGLDYFTEGRNTASPNNVIPAHSLTPSGAEANIDFVIISKGTGAITRDIPDNATSGGNKRGNYAIDLQKLRTTAFQVASGYQNVLIGTSNSTTSRTSASIYSAASSSVSTDYGTIIGGSNHSLSSGRYCIIGGGQNNTITGRWGGILSGRYNLIGRLSDYNAIISGYQNTIGHSTMSNMRAENSVILGGINNKVGTLSGGFSGRKVNNGAIVGGDSNSIDEGHPFTNKQINNSAIVGGSSNAIRMHSLQNTLNNFIAGGDANILRGYNSFALGGYGNEILDSALTGSQYNGFIGGESNVIDSLKNAIIIGGYKNEIDGGGSSGRRVIIGGRENRIAGFDSRDAVIIGGLENINYTTRGVILGGSKNITQSYNNCVAMGDEVDNVYNDNSFIRGAGRFTSEIASKAQHNILSFKQRTSSDDFVDIPVMNLKLNTGYAITLKIHVLEDEVGVGAITGGGWFGDWIYFLRTTAGVFTNTINNPILMAFGVGNYNQCEWKIDHTNQAIVISVKGLQNTVMNWHIIYEINEITSVDL